MNPLDRARLHDAMMNVQSHNLDDGILMSDALDNLRCLIDELKQRYLPSVVSQHLLEEYNWNE